MLRYLKKRRVACWGRSTFCALTRASFRSRSPRRSSATRSRPREARLSHRNFERVHALPYGRSALPCADRSHDGRAAHGAARPSEQPPRRALLFQYSGAARKRNEQGPPPTSLRRRALPPCYTGRPCSTRAVALAAPRLRLQETARGIDEGAGGGQKVALFLVDHAQRVDKVGGVEVEEEQLARRFGALWTAVSLTKQKP